MSYQGKRRGHSKPPKFTAQELMTLHGLTVEQALAKGYEVVGHKAEKSHRGAATPSAASVNNTVEL